MYVPKYSRPHFHSATTGPRSASAHERVDADETPKPKASLTPGPMQSSSLQILQPDEITGPIRDGSSGAELIAQSMAAPRNGRQFERTSRAVAAGWSNLARAARAQADVRNAVAFSLQRSAEIGAAARKACDDAAVHHARAMDQIHSIHDGAHIREATREDRVGVALAQARLDRAKATLEAEELRARSSAICAQQLLAVATAEAQRTAIDLGRNREERNAREEARLETLASGVRARAFLEEAELEYDQARTKRLDVRAKTERDRYDSAFSRSRPASTNTGGATEADAESVIQSLGTSATQSELRRFFYPALYGDDTCHPIAPVVRFVYREQRGLQGKPELEAIREAAKTAQTFLATPREQWAANLSEQYRDRLARLEGQIAAKEARELRDLIDREQSIFSGTEPFPATRF